MQTSPSPATVSTHPAVFSPSTLFANNDRTPSRTTVTQGWLAVTKPKGQLAAMGLPSSGTYPLHARDGVVEEAGGCVVGSARGGTVDCARTLTTSHSSSHVSAPAPGLGHASPARVTAPCSLVPSKGVTAGRASKAGAGAVSATFSFTGFANWSKDLCVDLSPPSHFLYAADGQFQDDVGTSSGTRYQ